MVLIRCKRRHFYDSNKFAECPYCAIEKSGLEEETKDFSVNSLEVTESVTNETAGGKEDKNGKG